MAEFPALPLFTDAYLADTRHLTTVQHGAYLLLLMEAWRRPSTNLPDDDMLLSKLAGLSTTDWADAKPVLMAFWALDNRTKTWSQKRLTDEKSYVTKHSKKQRSNAKARWDKDKSASHGNATTDAKCMPNECQNDAPTPTPTPTPTSVVARDAFEEADAALRKIEGIENHPVFAQPVIAPIWQLVQQGFDLKTQIAPSIRRQLKNINGKRITTWAYFVPGILEDAKPANSSPAPIATPEKWAERMEWARKRQQWGAVWGPMPGQNGCVVPSGLLKPTDGKGWTEYRPQE